MRTLGIVYTQTIKLNSNFLGLIMNPLKKSAIGSILLLTSFIKYYRSPEIFSSATIFLILGLLAV